MFCDIELYLEYRDGKMRLILQNLQDYEKIIDVEIVGLFDYENMDDTIQNSSKKTFNMDSGELYHILLFDNIPCTFQIQELEYKIEKMNENRNYVYDVRYIIDVI